MKYDAVILGDGNIPSQTKQVQSGPFELRIELICAQSPAGESCQIAENECALSLNVAAFPLNLVAACFREN
jgi:hypothetical protein